MIRRRALIAGLAASGLFASVSIGARRPAFWSDRLSVRTEGTGRDVILIPGLGSGPAVWDRLRADVPDARYTLTHVRGFAGLQPRSNRQGPLLDGITDALARYIREARMVRPLIVGHSMGGLIAIKLAARTDVAASGALIIDMLPQGAGMIGGTAEGTGYLASQLHGYFTRTKAGRQALANILMQAGNGGGAHDPDVIALALEELANSDVTPLLPDIGAQLRVLAAATADPQIVASQRARYAAAYESAPKVRIDVVSPSGHLVMADQPAAVARAVRALLR